jgi:Zn-dependent protease with chaperone function
MWNLSSCRDGSLRSGSIRVISQTGDNTLVTVIIIAVVLWVLFNFVAPFAVLKDAKRMTVANLPGEILYRANASKVRYYRAKLYGGAAFTVWSWPYKYIVMSDDFLKMAHPTAIRFVLAHELGHVVLGHTFKKWLAIVLLIGLIPPVHRWIMRDEDRADEYAEQLSGVPRSVLRGAANNETPEKKEK